MPNLSFSGEERITARRGGQLLALLDTQVDWERLEERRNANLSARREARVSAFLWLVLDVPDITPSR